MVGRQTWRKSVAFVLSVAACSAFLFALGASQPQAAGDIFERLRDGVRDGIRSLTGNRSASRASQSPAFIRAESPRAYSLEMDRLARDRTLLRLPGGDVDPRRDGGVVPDVRLPAEFYAPATSSMPPEAMEDPETGLFIPDDVEYWLVQYGEKRSTDLRDELEQLGGIEIVGFWPNTAYLVRVDSRQVDRMRNLSTVRWAGEYHPSHKVDLRLREQLAAGDDLSALLVDQRGMFRLLVTFHRDIRAESYRSQIESIPGLEILSLRDLATVGSAAYVEVPPSALGSSLVQLAQMRDVLGVSLDEVPVPDNDHSVWFMQTGIADTGLNNFDQTARFFTLGINGQGLGGMVIDDGYENGLCQFRYTANLEDVTFQTIPDTPLEPEGGTLAANRTRLRKISSYIVFPGAAPYSSSVQHGTGTAGCMVADNYGHATTGGSLAARPLIRDIGRAQNISTCEDPTFDWSVGQLLRTADPDMRVDDPRVDQPTISNSFGGTMEHHDARDGMAPGAHLVAGDIGGADGGLSGIVFGFQAVDLAWTYGATSMNMSFGGGACTACYNGSAPGADLGAWLHRMVLPFSSAGNSGNTGVGTVGSGFAQGKNVVTVGATVRSNNASAGYPRTGENVAGYSSRGPKSGGLLAPNLMAPGSIVTVANGSLAVNAEDGTGSGAAGCIAQQGNNDGTSFSSPTLAGIALLVQQYFLDGWYPSGAPEVANEMRPTNALTRAVLTNSARNLHGARTNDDGMGVGFRPNLGQGWGAPRIDDTLFFVGDPIKGEDPFGDTQRARMVVLTDTPNGLNDTGLLLPEPGGTLRNQIVQNFQPAITDGAIHEFPLNIIKNPSDPSHPENELRVTMCYSDVDGTNPTGRTTVNDLDLEAISPSGVVYRTSPNASWDQGYSVPAQDQVEQVFEPFVGFTDYPDRDPNNVCENVFLPPDEVEEGTWTIRVIGFDVPGNGRVRNDATPNFVNDQTPTIDTDVPCDGIPDVDSTDQIFSTQQGYALLVSGNFTTTQGTVALNRTSFLCEGEELGITVSDQNGDQAAEAPCADRTEVTVDVVTTIPNAGFTADHEIVTLAGAEPIYQTADDLPIDVVADPALVVHGDGRIQIAEGQQILVSYVDTNPCGGEAFAQATVACRPNISEEGFTIDEGCDLADASDPTSEVRPDDFMDAGELNVYTVRFANNGGSDLTDTVISLRPDAEDPLMTAMLPGGIPASTLIEVINSPQPVGLAPPGRLSDARFLVQMGIACDDPSIAVPDCNPSDDGMVTGIPPQYSLDFIACVTSPADGLLYPDCFTQTQSLESDVESFRYDTRDPAGELFGLGLVERQIAGPPMSTNPNDYVQNSPMWFDPGANAGDCDGPGPDTRSCAEVCNIPRADWDAANIANPGSGAVPPPQCFAAATGNPTDPWDFEEDDEGFEPAVYDADVNQVGPPGAPGGQEWFWKNAAMGGGGCGWEDEIVGALDSLGIGVHPDVPAEPWGIWHTGAINGNASATGPYPDAMPPSAGVPANDDEASPDFRTILWRPTGAVTDNSNGEWCDSYISNTALTNFYRSFLMPPDLFRVHRSEPEFRVEFRDFRAYSRMDGHTIDGDNLSVAGWYFSNEPMPPINPSPRSHTWGQPEMGTLIFSDEVEEQWEVEDSFIDENLRTPNPSFSDFTYEDFFGPAEDSWNFMLTWGHLHFDGFTSNGQYGWGIDDVSFVWTEARDVADRSDCGSIADPSQPPLVFLGESRYNACEGELDIVVRDLAQTLPEIAVCVRSAAEDYEVALLRPTGAPGEYSGTMPFSADPRFAADGVISIISGQVDVGRGADTVTIEYDPGNVADHTPGTSAEEICDWLDSDGDGRNDDFLPAPDGDGINDAEDGLTTGRNREVRDSAAMNCTSGLIFAIKHSLQDADAAGDMDRFADRGETVWMSLQLASQLGANLENVEITITTEDDTVCILQDTVLIDELEGNNTLTDTPIAPSADIGRQGFLFAVPSAVQTTDLEQPQQVTFRVDVKGVRQDNLNEFTTFGDGFNSYLPLEVTLFLDLDESPTTADYVDPVISPPRNPGQFIEGFEGLPAFGGYDHPRSGGQPGWSLTPLVHDARTDSRYGADSNNGFCPECTDCEIPDDCEYAFDGDLATNFGQWQFTSDWAYAGVQAMKFGEPGAAPTRQDQSYEEGQYTSIESPPLYLANDDAVTPELSFRHIADFWQVTFTGGLSTVLGSGVLEVSANPAGLPLPIQRAQESEIRRLHPMDSFRRVYPYQRGYDSVTDALNACRTLYCGYHHPVFGRQGDPLNASTDIRGGIKGGTWEEVRVDLSDFKGMQVVFRWTVAVLQDLSVQSGRIGWLLDEIVIDGAATRSAFALETDVPVADPCGIVAAVETTAADCYGDETYIFDRHSGLGNFDSGTGSPFPIEYEWSIGGSTIRGFAEDPAVDAGNPTAWRGRCENPILRLSELVGGAGTYALSVNYYQDGMLVGSTSVDIDYKDAPVPALTLVSDGPFQGAQTRFEGSATVLPAPDPARDLVYIWDFGDGTGVDTSGPNVNHVFANEGTYDVTLCVRDEDGCESCVSEPFVVVAAPAFNTVVANVSDDCADPGSPAGVVGDGNPDFNEFVTLDLSFTNSGAAATGVVGYLGTADRNVEIVQGTADFGDVGMGAGSAPRPFTFIYRDDSGAVPTCLVVPFSLTLVGNSGTVVQEVLFSVTMGQGSDVSDNGPLGPLPCGFAKGDPGGLCAPGKPGLPGCLDGMRFRVDISGSNLATLGELNVTLISPNGTSAGLHFGDGVDLSRNLVIDCHFGVDADLPIADTGGALVCTEGMLPAVTEATIIEDFTGEPLDGPQPWRIEARPRVGTGADASSIYTVNEAIIELEGKESTDLEIAVEGACDTCVTSQDPIYSGLSVSCLPGAVDTGALTWPPAQDTTTCGGIDDLEYTLYVSTVAGQLGNPVGAFNDPADDCLTAGPGTAYPRAPGASTWLVCGIDAHFWTVVVTDNGDVGTRVPDISAPADAVPAGYQTGSTNCLEAPTGPIMGVTTAPGGTLELWVADPAGAGGRGSIPGLRAGSGTAYTVFRGSLDSLWSAAQGDPAGYDHQTIQCSEAGPSMDVGTQGVLPGEPGWYYLLPSNNAGGCGGLGYRGTPNPAGGLRFTEGRSNGPNGASCPPAEADCLP
jgi:PKD repeat protein